MAIKNWPTACLNSHREARPAKTTKLMWLPGSSQQQPLDAHPPNRVETRMDDDQENPSIAMAPPDKSMIDDIFTLSGAAIPAQDELDRSISQMDAADIESELNNPLTIDDSGQYPPLVTDPSTNLEPAAMTSVSDLPSDHHEGWERWPSESKHAKHAELATY